MKKKFFFDACSLIYLTKINIKEKLPLLGESIIGPKVEKELISNPERFKDAKKLKDNIRKETIRKIDSKSINVSSLSTNLGEGEKECIELCLSEKGVFITDDHKALNFAISQGLKPKTSEYILLDFLENEIIDYRAFEIFFRKLAKVKLLNTKIINFIENKAKKIRNKTETFKEEENK